MVKGFPFFLVRVVGVSIDAWGVYSAQDSAIPQQVPAPVSLRCDTDEVSQARARVAELERELELARVQRASSPELPGKHEVPVGATHTADLEQGVKEREESLNWKISALEKFVPLSDDQKSRLKEKYKQELEARQRGESAQTESLDDIIGAENASYYRQQVQAAFNRMEAEETGKEVLFMSRQLSLSSEQEESVRRVFAEVEAQIETTRASNTSESAHDRVKGMIDENKRRNALRSDELKKILSPSQYQSFMASQAESAAADGEGFHDPGAH